MSRRVRLRPMRGTRPWAVRNVAAEAQVLPHGLTKGHEARLYGQPADPCQHQVPGGLAAAVEGVTVILGEAVPVFVAKDITEDSRGEPQKRHMRLFRPAMGD